MDAIIRRRPTVSNRWPSANGPTRLPTAKAMKNSGTDPLSTSKKEHLRVGNRTALYPVG
ncbi:hypothetical protein ACI780_21325 [Geodermatophilus sp. SYSU D00814]